MDQCLILIATHHKTGTVWMREMFEEIAGSIGARFLRAEAHAPIDTEALKAASQITILFQDHGHFDQNFSPSPNDKGWHLIRDPRDVLISGANYHSWSHEDWLHQPRERLKGQTYQEAIKKLSFTDSIRFEMDSSTGQSIQDMVSFNRRNGTFRDVIYEDLISDPIGIKVAELFEFLGFFGRNLQIALEIYEASHAAGKKNTEPELNQHIQNLDRFQWRYMYDAALLEDYEKRFSNASVKLGYPPSDPALLLEDIPRNRAYLARFFANRSALNEAREHLNEGLKQHPSAPELLSAQKIIQAR